MGALQVPEDESPTPASQDVHNLKMARIQLGKFALRDLDWIWIPSGKETMGMLSNKKGNSNHIYNFLFSSSHGKNMVRLNLIIYFL